MDLLDDTIKPDLKIKGITFIFGQVNLIIKKKSLLFNNEIKRFNYASITKIEFITPRSESTYLAKVMFQFLIRITTSLILPHINPFNNQFNKHVLFNYLSGEDKAVFRLDLNIKKKDFLELQKTLVELKHQNNIPTSSLHES